MLSAVILPLLLCPNLENLPQEQKTLLMGSLEEISAHSATFVGNDSSSVSLQLGIDVSDYLGTSKCECEPNRNGSIGIRSKYFTVGVSGSNTASTLPVGFNSFFLGAPADEYRAVVEITLPEIDLAHFALTDAIFTLYRQGGSQTDFYVNKIVNLGYDDIGGTSSLSLSYITRSSFDSGAMCIDLLSTVTSALQNNEETITLLLSQTNSNSLSIIHSATATSYAMRFVSAQYGWGAALPYIADPYFSGNCYAYALNQNYGNQQTAYDLAPGIYSYFSGNNPTLSGYVETYLLPDIEDKGFAARVIDGYDSAVSLTERRIAFRIRLIDYGYDIGVGFHFMRQSFGGNWAEFIIGSGMSSNAGYDYPDYDANWWNYNSETVYIAIAPES